MFVIASTAADSLETLPLTLGDVLLMISIFSASGLAVWRISMVINSLKTRVVDLEKDKFGMSQASELALRFALANRDSRVPDPRDPNHLLGFSLETDED